MHVLFSHHENYIFLNISNTSLNEIWQDYQLKGINFGDGINFLCSWNQESIFSNPKTIWVSIHGRLALDSCMMLCTHLENDRETNLACRINTGGLHINFHSWNLTWNLDCMFGKRRGKWKRKTIKGQGIMLRFDRYYLSRRSFGHVRVLAETCYLLETCF